MRAARHRTTSAGFSLVEIAIVLIVIGLIIAAIGLAATRATDYTRRQQAIGGIAATVANLRAYYGGQAGMPATSYTNLMQTMLTSNIVPSYLSRGGAANCTNPGNMCADHPWGEGGNGALDPTGTFRVCNWSWGDATAGCAKTPIGISPFFGIALTSLSRKDCTAMLEGVSSSTQATGLVEINVNGHNFAENGVAIQPVPVSDANSAQYGCSSAVDGNDSVTFVYRLIAPAL